ncbi:MAG TPA: BTAD domain-containing putative transcriptional regulator [Candidatus Elarobacter sp.]|nr:BTAD domain-containing putative transcriptional regulator [Candidatus Elarobacter sp.]
MVDQIDELSSDARELLRRAVETCPAATRLVLAARSDSVRELAGAPARLADPALFRFDADELLQLCEANGVSFAASESELALQMTNGWATALAETVRAARRGPLPLADAARDWRSGGGVVVQSVVQRVLELVPPHDAALLTTVLAEPQRATNAQLKELAGRGLFVDVVDGRAQLNPVVAARGRSAARVRLGRDDAPTDEPASIALFGEFRMTVQNAEVHFSRRRDRQIIQYLALAPGGRATRNELFDTFWPRGGRDSRSQNLRTSCSMIRSALARCAGRENVDRYFRVEGGFVILDLEHVTCDLDAFETEVARATEAELAGDALRARSAWAAAVALHTAPLLEDEPPAPWIARRAAQVEEAAARARHSAGAAAPRTTERRAARLVSR